MGRGVKRAGGIVMSNNKKCVHGELLVASSHKLGLLVTLN